MNSKKGSQWRKWDLQVGTNKYTNYNGPILDPNQLTKLKLLTGLDKSVINSKHNTISNEDYAKLFVEYFVNFTDINVIAITNHNTGEGIDEILNYLNSKKNPNDSSNIYKERVIFPGVEVGGNDRCHLLVIFNPLTKNNNKFVYETDGKTIKREKNWSEYIENFLSKICIPNQRFINDSPANSSNHGLLQMLNHYKEWDFIPILPHINRSDGWWKELQESNRKETILHPAFGIVEINSLGNNNFLERILDGEEDQWGKKSIAKIKTSDANSLTKIGTSFTWIKSDLTFEGLQQIIFEPKKRVNIGTNNPNEINKKICITNVEFSDSKEFPIKNQQLEFNRDLVCIIGGRGSGKSALFESIAYCFDQHKSYKLSEDKLINQTYFIQKQSFIDYYISSENSNVKIKLSFTDKDLNPLDVYITDLKNKSSVCSYPFLYLGQNQIEYYADNAKEIHRIAFDTILKQTTLSNDIYSLQSKIQQKKQGLIDVNKEIERLRESINNYDENKLMEDKNKVENDIKLFSSKETKEIINEFNQSREKFENLRELEELLGETHADEIDKDFEIYGKIYVLIKKFEDDINTLLLRANKIAKILNPGIEELTLDLSTFKNKIKIFIESIDKKKILSEYEEALSKVNEKLKGITEVSVSYLTSQRNKLSEINTALKELGKLKSLLKEKENFRELTLNSLHQLFQDYENKYSEAITEFNSTNKDVLKGIKMEAKKIFQINELVSNLFKLTDGRRSKNISYFKKNWLKIIDDSKFDTIKWYKEFVAEEENQKVFLDFNINVIDSIVYSDYNLLETNISYEVEENLYKSINQLSLGQKGTILLKFYLSSGNECPILIDQPEDHLDNDFIYKDLVKTIRDVKEKRQLIIITHDANLVVNGDAEQIIVANYKDEKIDHNLSGAIENSEIRTAITKILEGGDEAFRKRELKYQFKD